MKLLVMLMGLSLAPSMLAGLKAKPPRNPHYVVQIGGTTYDSWKHKQLIKQVTVELATDQASEALFRVFDPDFEIIDGYTGDDGVPELPVKVWMGFGNDLGEPVFKGLLDRIERGDTDTTFRVYDMGRKMRRELKNEYHGRIDDLGILRKLVIRNGLRFEGPTSAVQLDQHDDMAQDFKNDWEHSHERAQEAGFNIYVRQDTFFAKEPAVIGPPRLTLTYGKDFILVHNFDLSYKLPENQQGRPQEVTYHVRGKGGRRVEGYSKKHKRGHKRVHGNEEVSIHTKSYADRRAHASKQLQREHAFSCTVRSISPLPGLRPDARDTVVLRNVGALFSGPYLADRVRHDGTAQALVCEYMLYRDIEAG